MQEGIMKYKFHIVILMSLLWMEVSMAMTFSSPDISNHGDVPSKFTCDGEDLVPTLKWSDAPANTQSFVVIVDDPDAPGGTWTHWVLFNIPKTIQEIVSGAA